MKRLYALIVAASLCFPSIGALAWWQSIQQVAVATGGVCSQATTFLARANAVTTLNGTHTTAYTNLICNGVTHGWWAKMDVLQVYATQSSGVALLNLPNSTYTASTGGSLVFTADQGFNGNSTTDQVTTTFNPSTATSPNFIQNSAHLSAWSLNSGQSGNAHISIGASGDNLFSEFSDGNAYIRVNDNPESGGFANSTPSGFFLGNRDSSTTRQAYLNGVSLGTYGSITSQAGPNFPLIAVGGGGATTVNVTAAISAGGSLNSTDQLNFYNDMRAYMTAVGVP